jgi:transcriptional regulator with XRE-family HTH domain
MSPRPKDPVVPVEDIGRRIRDLRIRAGLTQTEVAEALGTKQTGISAYERGARALTLPALMRIAEALGTTPNAILGVEAAPLPPLEDRRLLRRLQKAQGLPRRQKLALLKWIDEFLAKVAK